MTDKVKIVSKIELEIKELEAKKKELTDAIVRFNENKIKAEAGMKEAEAKSWKVNQAVMAAEKKLTESQKQIDNIAYALKDKFAKEQLRLNELKAESLEMLEESRLKRQRAESMLASTVKERVAMKHEMAALENARTSAQKSAIIIKELEEKKVEIAQRSDELDTKQKDIYARLVKLQAQEEIVDAKTKEANKRIALAQSVEADIKARKNEVDILVEKYKAAIKDVEKQERELKEYEGSVAIRESAITEREVAAHSALESAKQKELEVKSTSAKIRKLIRDKNLEKEANA